MSASTPERVDLSKYIEVKLFGDRPHIRGRRVPIAVIVYQTQANGWTITEAAWNFTLSEAEILAAMLYYQEHKSEIDRQEAEEFHQFREMKRSHGKD